MTARTDKLATKTLAAITRFGAAATLVDPGGVYASGAVTETPTSVSVTLVGPVDEAQRYAATGAATGVTGTFYLAASGLAFAPRNGFRIVFGSRTFAIIQTTTYELQGVALAYQCDVGEIGDE